MSVVLLNPPAPEVHLRDLYCSITSKGNYLWPPIDLLALSGRFHERFGVTVIDAIAEPASPEAVLGRVAALKPRAVISMTGSASWRGDFKLLAAIKKETGALIAVSGDIAVDPDSWFLDAHPWLDALIGDFTGPGIVDFVAAGGRPEGTPPGLRYRTGGGPRGGPPAPGGERTFSYPVPRHELFPLDAYRLPFVTRYPFTSILTNYACPFTCSYCIQNRSVLGHRGRPLDNVLAEMDAASALGVRELYFRDPLFESRPAGALELCRRMSERYDFRWACNSRVDTLTPELAESMSAAGCRCVAFGFETADERVLREHGKRTTQAQALRAVALCREAGMRVAGYFILGLPGETRDSVLDTIRFARESGIDYASFSLPSPDYGTGLRRAALAGGKNGNGFRDFNRSRPGGASASEIPERELAELLRKAVVDFYARPSIVFRTLAGIRGTRQAVETAKSAWTVLRGS